MSATSNPPAPPRACTNPRLTRRDALLAAAATLAAPRAGATSPLATSPLAEAPTILVAGPEGGRLERWARLLAPALLPGLPRHARLQLQASGGEDGVTGANQFATRVAPDGNTLLLLPGEAALAWQVGDRRAQFDAANWLGVMAGLTPALVVGWTSPEALRPGQALRIATSGPAGPELAALLGFEVMGCAPVPVYGVGESAAAGGALAAHAVDAVLLRGRDVADQCARLTALGAKPIFALGTGVPGGWETGLPPMPGLLELATRVRGTPPAPRLVDAWRSVAAAAQLEFALVLPHLSPAALVALWHQAGTLAAASAELRDEASDIRTIGAPAAHAAVQALAPEPATLQELRGWLATRMSWRPS